MAHQQQRFAHHHPHDAGPAGADGDADADLPRAPGGAVGHHAVQADARQGQREGGKERGEKSEHPLATSDISTVCSIVATSVTSPAGTISAAMARIEAVEPRDVAGPAHRDSGLRDRIDRLLQRQVGHALVRRSQVLVARIGDDADDLELVLDPLSREIDDAAKRRLIAEEGPGGGLVENGDTQRTRPIARSEHSAAQQADTRWFRNSHR